MGCFKEDCMRAKAALTLSACAFSLAIASSAIAQETTPPAAAESAANEAAPGADIVVTARRVSESASKVPVAITAFSAAQIQTKNIQNVADLTKLTPGLNITGGGSRTNVFITIRGQSRGVTGNVSPGVITYFNEVPMQTYGSLIPTFDMDNIQVLKGPQGTLFGRNSIGGAVLTYSKAPTHNFGGYVEGEIGEYNRQKIEGAINIPIIPEKVALRLSGQLDHSASYTKNYQFTKSTIDPVTHRVNSLPQLVPNTHNLDEFATTSFRASLLIEPVEGVKNVTVYDYNKVRGTAGSDFDQFFPTGVPGRTSSGAVYFNSPTTLRAIAGFLNTPGVVPPDGLDKAENIISLAHCGTSFSCDIDLFNQVQKTDGRQITYSNFDPWASYTKIWGISNTTTIELGEHATLKNIFGYRTNDSYTRGDNDGTPLQILDTDNLIQTKLITEELQLSGSLFDNKLKYTLGGFYYKQSPNGPGGSAALEINTFFGLSHNASYSYFTDTSKALYGQLDYKVVDGVTLTAGYRQNWDTSTGCVAALNYSAFAAGIVQQDQSVIPGEAACRSGTLPTRSTAQASSSSSAVLPLAHFNKGTWNLGVNWQITPDAMVYAATRRGYRAGSFNSPLYDAYLASVQTFKPETLDDIEIGAKLRWRGPVSGSLDIALFRGTDKDVQIPFQTSQLVAGTAGLGCVPGADLVTASSAPLCTVTSGPDAGKPGRTVPVPSATTYVNAGRSRLQGFELAATLSPTEGLTLSGGLSYVDFTALSVTNDPALAAVYTANKRTVPPFLMRQQPEWTANAGIYYEYPRDVLGGRLAFNSDLRYTSRWLEGDYYIEGKTTVDASIGLKGIGGTGVDASVQVINLFNAKYDYGSFGSSAALGYKSTIYGQPRTVSLRLRYTFGR
jgi:iron complex outermembrane receptor protein